MKTVKIACTGADAIALDMLTPFQGDLKDLHKDDYEKLKREILADGFSAPVFVWESGSTFYILDGHQRVRTLQQMRSEGYTIPDIPVDFIEAADEKQAKRKVLALTSQYGRMTGDGLYEFMHGAGMGLPELEDFRFPEIDVDSFKAEYFEDGGLTDPDEIPSVDDGDVYVKPGDVWKLGEHTVVCGDSSALKIPDASAMVTDPPYGQNQDGVSGDAPELLPRVVSALSAVRAGIAAVFQSPRTFPAALDSMRRSGYRFERMLWLYKEAQMSYPWRGWLLKSEAILVFSLGTAQWNDVKPYSHDCYKLSEVSGELGPGEGWHGSVKPLAVVADLVQRVTPASGHVADPFLGSGTTLIACEKLGRKCYGVEIEPKYVQVTIERWQNYTGQQAERVSQSSG